GGDGAIHGLVEPSVGRDEIGHGDLPLVGGGRGGTKRSPRSSVRVQREQPRGHAARAIGTSRQAASPGARRSARAARSGSISATHRQTTSAAIAPARASAMVSYPAPPPR